MSIDKVIRKGIEGLIHAYLKEDLKINEVVEKLKNELPSDQHKLIEEVGDAIKLEAEHVMRINSSITGVRSQSVEPWYFEQDIHKFWPSYKRTLKELKGFENDAIENLDESTNKTLNSTQNPNANKVNTRGLVVGYVQSGKTANYIGLISKAADAGYKLIIVLTGTKEALRKQTQQRIETDLLKQHPENWFRLTTSRRDFRKNIELRPQQMMVNNTPGICVIKKNQVILNNLTDWLTKQDGHTESHPRLVPKETRDKCPVLVIDDECDEASINVSREDKSRIYQRITDLINHMPKTAYIGYTATPFANVLIDQESFAGLNLYPVDFIYHLPKPKDYFGPSDIFGRDRTSSEEEDADLGGKNMFREVSVADVQKLRPIRQNLVPTFLPQNTESLNQACYYFWVSTAAKIARMGNSVHTTMFIHTHVRALMHERTYDLVEKVKKFTLNQINNGNSNFLLDLKKIWEEESNKVPSAENERHIPFSEIQSLLKDVIERTEVVQKNINNKGQLGYKNELGEDVFPGKIYILIGGNILSRGLTLEGLTVSYFLRTTSMYDTLLQMGRWFGFRKNYSDLPRIWMTRALERNFYRLALVEQEIREDIDLYEKLRLTPREFGVRIRCLPGMLVTSRLKMRDAKHNNITFDRRRPEISYFPINDEEWLKSNITTFKDFILDNCENLDAKNSSDTLKIIRNIEHKKIRKFMDDFLFHPDETVNKSTLIKYSNLLFEKKLLRNWNIIIIGKKETSLGVIEINNNISVNCLNRAKFGTGSDPAYFKTVSSKDDVIKDIQDYKEKLDWYLVNSQFQDKDNRDIYAKAREKYGDNVRIAQIKNLMATRHFFKMRRDLCPLTGLLVFYLISKDSKKTGENSMYEDLMAKNHVVSFMTIFPPSKDEALGADIQANYVSARVPGLVDDEGEADNYDEGEEDDE